MGATKCHPSAHGHDKLETAPGPEANMYKVKTAGAALGASQPQRPSHTGPKPPVLGKRWQEKSQLCRFLSPNPTVHGPHIAVKLCRWRSQISKHPQSYFGDILNRDAAAEQPRIGSVW